MTGDEKSHCDNDNKTEQCHSYGDALAFEINIPAESIGDIGGSWIC